MRLIVTILIALCASGCTKHALGAWVNVPQEAQSPQQPDGPSGSTEAVDPLAPPPDASFPRMSIPLHAKDPLGNPAEPITLVVVAGEAALVSAFASAGWLVADPLTPENTQRMRSAQTWSEPYPQAPIAPLTYWGREQDAAWQLPGSTVANRSRVRVWRSEERDAKDDWIWALNVAQDDGFIGVPTVGIPVHHMRPDLDDATARLAEALTQSGAVRRQYRVMGIGPNLGFRNAYGEPYRTAGWVHVLEF